jgi:hypothetical protein
MNIGIGIGVGLSKGGGSGVVTLYSDDFNRQNDSSTMGPQYAISFGGTYGVLNNEGYASTPFDGSVVLATANNGTGDFTAICRMKGALTDGANSSRFNFIFKGQDSQNFLYISPAGGSLSLRKFDTGTGSTIGTPASYTMVNDTYNTYKVVYAAATGAISVYVDGTLRISYTLNTVPADLTKYGASTYNKIGWRLSNLGTPATQAKLDDISITTP